MSLRVESTPSALEVETEAFTICAHGQIRTTAAGGQLPDRQRTLLEKDPAGGGGRKRGDDLCQRFFLLGN